MAVRSRNIYGFVLTSEVLGDVAGGMRTGAVFQGKLETIVKADLEKMFGLRGLSFFANSFQIHNTGGIRRDHVGSFNTISNIEAVPRRGCPSCGWSNCSATRSASASASSRPTPSSSSATTACS